VSAKSAFVCLKNIVKRLKKKKLTAVKKIPTPIKEEEKKLL
jgi:hypothetical protein